MQNTKPKYINNWKYYTKRMNVFFFFLVKYVTFNEQLAYFLKDKQDIKFI